MPLEACHFCGEPLAVGAVGCFRCGRLVEKPEQTSGTGAGVVPTQLGTLAQATLLEGQWRLVRQLGRGPQSEVWQGLDVTLDRPVAVKLLPATLATDPLQTARFEKDARVLAAFDHPNLAAVLGLGRQGAQPFFVTRLLEGWTLGELMHQWSGKLPVHKAIAVFSAVCDGLAALHREKVVHGNLKPSNVFIGQDDQVTVLDPGSPLTREGSGGLSAELLSTPAYLSPEQTRGGAAVEGSSDVFALGCLLFEALTGVRAFPGESDQVLAAQQLPTRPDAAAHGAPPALAELARQAMALAPDARPTALEFKARLGVAPAPEAITAPRAAEPPAKLLAPLMDEDEPKPKSSTRLMLEAVPGVHSAVLLETAAREEAARSHTRQMAPLPPPRSARWTAAAAGVLLLLLGFVLLVYRPDPPPPLPPPMKLTGLNPAPVPDTPKATPDLIARQEELEKAAVAAEQQKRQGHRGAAKPKVTRRTATSIGTTGLGELQIVAELDGQPVTANLSLDQKPIGPSPLYLPVKPGVHWVSVERRPLQVGEFPITVAAHETVRLEVELSPLKDSPEP